MTVRRGDNGVIVLDGVCPVEDAEPLLQMLQAMPAAQIDWKSCHQVHTAVLQLVLASGRVPVGPCGDDRRGMGVGEALHHAHAEPHREAPIIAGRLERAIPA